MKIFLILSSLLKSRKIDTPYHFKVVCFIIFFFLLPFVFLQDFFPLFRLGMFAEPFRASKHHEYFTVCYTLSEKRIGYSPDALAMPESVFRQLLRNWHYRQQDTLLLLHLHNALKAKQPDSAVKSMELWHHLAHDSVLVCRLKF